MPPPSRISSRLSSWTEWRSVAGFIGTKLSSHHHVGGSDFPQHRTFKDNRFKRSSAFVKGHLKDEHSCLGRRTQAPSSTTSVNGNLNTSDKHRERASVLTVSAAAEMCEGTHETPVRGVVQQCVVPSIAVGNHPFPRRAFELLESTSTILPDRGSSTAVLAVTVTGSLSSSATSKYDGKQTAAGGSESMNEESTVLLCVRPECDTVCRLLHEVDAEAFRSRHSKPDQVPSPLERPEMITIAARGKETHLTFDVKHGWKLNMFSPSCRAR